MKYTLKTPIQIADAAPITELTLREAVTGNDVADVKFSELADPSVGLVAKIVGRLAGLTDAHARKFDLADVMALTPVVMGFLARGLETGTKP